MPVANRVGFFFLFGMERGGGKIPGYQKERVCVLCSVCVSVGMCERARRRAGGKQSSPQNLMN